MGPKVNKKADLESLREARPYLRTGVALIIWLRYREPIEEVYEWADEFLNKLEKDVEQS